MVASVEDMRTSVPSHDSRKRILATDALASVDEIRVMVQLTFQYLFGMLFCQICPHCNSSPCQDMFGSHATAESGV